MGLGCLHSGTLAGEPTLMSCCDTEIIRDTVGSFRWARVPRAVPPCKELTVLPSGTGIGVRVQDGSGPRNSCRNSVSPCICDASQDDRGGVLYGASSRELPLAVPVVNTGAQFGLPSVVYPTGIKRAYRMPAEYAPVEFHNKNTAHRYTRLSYGC